MKLPKAEQKLDEWQTAIHCLMGAAEGRDFMMHARIGMLQALNRHSDTTFITRRVVSGHASYAQKGSDRAAGS
jgi:hypothetical protein